MVMAKARLQKSHGLVAALALAAAILFPALAVAKVKVSESTRYYQVHGSDGFEVSKAMLSSGQRNINMRHAIAATSTKFSLGEAQVGVRNGRCVVEDVEVNLEIEYLYPKWASKNTASPSVRRAWDSFYAELLKHERTHGEIAKKAAKRMERELKKLSGTVALGCRDFGQFADQRFRRIAEELKREQLAFDARENRRQSRISKLQVALLKSR
jgi:predicted secreted Zn-dependent protease